MDHTETSLTNLVSDLQLVEGNLTHTGNSRQFAISYRDFAAAIGETRKLRLVEFAL